MAATSAGRTCSARQPWGRATNRTDRLVRSTRVSTAEVRLPSTRSPSPMTRHRPAVRLGGPLVHWDGVDELAAALGQALAPRVAHGPAGAQTTPQVAAQRPTALDVQAQVDGLVGDAHGRVVGVSHPKPARYLLR
jgi:hypothetical protein